MDILWNKAEMNPAFPAYYLGAKKGWCDVFKGLFRELMCQSVERILGCHKKVTH